MRLPTFKELRRFVEVEGWTDKDVRSGKKKGDHHRYVFTTPTGDRLYTRASHGRGQPQDADLFRHLLRDQLAIDEEQFWAAVDQGKAPTRTTPTTQQSGPGIDAKLARNLLTKVGVSPVDLSQMTQSDAVERWNYWLTNPR